MAGKRLSVAEARRHERCTAWAASAAQEKPLLCWAHNRGRLEPGSGDGGSDLIAMAEGGFPKVLLSGAKSVSAAFSACGAMLAVQADAELLVAETASWELVSWLALEAGEGFLGTPVWLGRAALLVGIGGKRQQLFKVEADGKRSLLFTAEPGGGLLAWDGLEGRVAVVHRLAYAMFAEVRLLSEDGKGPGRLVGVDARVEYCKPSLALLTAGRLLMRLNLPVEDVDEGDPEPPEPLQYRGRPLTIEEMAAMKKDKAPPARHGLWLLGAEDAKELSAVGVMPGMPHGDYDVFSGSYAGGQGVVEGIVVSAGRDRAVVAARRLLLKAYDDCEEGDELVSYTDKLYLLHFDGTETREVSVGKGCHVPVALGEKALICHHRSPVEWGDLWAASLADGQARRLTETMPVSLKKKLVTPREVAWPSPMKDCDEALHCLIFAPEGGEEAIQPLLWAHGGPMAQLSWDYNPLLSYLASLGYLVIAPNFSGSTGRGLAYMDRVLGEGCGMEDLEDCWAVAKYVLCDSKPEELHPRLDLSRGMAIAGHSWGGYLVNMAMLSEPHSNLRLGKEHSVFSCGISMAGIADWCVQQRHTDVRYYDYALMGGWVYDRDVAKRAAKASPKNSAKKLKAPLLILHGEADTDVPFAQIPPFLAALGAAEHPLASVEYHSYPGQGHGIAGTKEQADVLARLEKFLRINLKPWNFTDNPHGEVTAY